MNFGQGGVIGIAVENILEDTFDLVRGRRTGVKRHRAFLVAKAQRTEIIEPENVIGMCVGVEDRVDARDALANGLRVEVGRGVYENDAAVISDHHRWSRAPVVRMDRRADAAVATERGDTHRSAPSEHGECRLHATLRARRWAAVPE